MRKVLIIPSWYPTENRPLEGSFFREQALAMKDLYEIKIFYPQSEERGRLSKLMSSLFYMLRLKPEIEFLKDNYACEPEKYSFHYSGGIGRLRLGQKMLEWQCLAAFEKVLETGWKPDVIHAQCTSPGGIISSFISKKYNVPFIITEHNIFLLHLYPEKIRTLMKSALENARIVIAVSEHQKKMILMQGINCHPVVVGNMVDDSIFDIAPKKLKIFNILYISYDHYIKDNETFFRAVKMFQQKMKDPFTVKILGRNTMSDRSNTFENLRDNFDLGNQVEIIEYVEREEIVKFFHETDVLVSTSIAETFGISLCEALFCGVPIISTANGGVDEMITDRNGIKVRIQDEAAICNALLKIFNKEIIFNPQEIRNSVINKFTKEIFRGKMDEIYSSALNP
jgi:glycosyltransferase involved in cell wall biosynthesis